MLLNPESASSRLFQLLKDDPMALLPLQETLTSPQLIAAFGILSALNAGHAPSVVAVNTLLQAITPSQLLVWKRHLTCRQFSALEEALAESTAAVGS